jgi:hypothetical protein
MTTDALGEIRNGREPWWSHVLMEWVAKIGVPAAIAFSLLFLQTRKLDEIGVKLDRLINLIEARK